MGIIKDKNLMDKTAQELKADTNTYITNNYYGMPATGNPIIADNLYQDNQKLKKQVKKLQAEIDRLTEENEKLEDDNNVLIAIIKCR